MKKTTIFLFLLILALFVFNTCSLSSYGLNEFLVRDADVNFRTKELKQLKNINAETSNYRILVVSDVHFGAENLRGNGPRRDSEFFKWLEKYITKNPILFCVSLGDIAEHGWEKEFKEYNENFTKKLKSLFNIDTYNVVGNHDLYNSGWKYFSQHMYPNNFFYCFKIIFENAPMECFFIDTASGSLGVNQMRELKNAMKKSKNPKIVMSHFPLWAEGHFYFSLQNTAERNALISNFAKYNVKAVLTGHTHKQTVSDFGKFTEYNYPGFFAKSGWGVITVNENNVTNEFFYLDQK